MPKDTYYFSHDSNARNDEKILMLRAECGWGGYGIYWALIEMMFENEETSLKCKAVKGIAVSFNIDITVLQSVINTCITTELFVSDEENFWSESLRKRKSEFHKSREKKSLAGKKGMESRWKMNENNGFDNNAITPLYQDDNTDITKDNKVKESKGKESKLKDTKENKYREIFDYYLSLKLTNHKTYTISMAAAIKKVVDVYGTDEVKKLLDRHKQVVELTKDSEYKVKVRGLNDFFSQKANKEIGSSLIYEEYLEGGKKYEQYLKGSVKDGKFKGQYDEIYDNGFVFGNPDEEVK